MSRASYSDNPFQPSWRFVTILIMVIVAGYHFVKRQQARHWEPAQGVIQTSRVRCHGLDKCSWNLSYRYSYHDRKYLGSRYRHAFETKSYLVLKPLADQYPDNMGVTVYVNPDNPSESVLERDL